MSSGALTGVTTISASGSINGLTEIISTTTSLTPSQSGATLLPSATSAQTFTLPDPTSSTGVYYTFVAGSAEAHVINCATAVISYAILSGAGYPSFGDSRLQGVISITLGAGGNIGDTLNIVSNGTNWFVTGVVANSLPPEPTPVPTPVPTPA